MTLNKSDLYDIHIQLATIEAAEIAFSRTSIEHQKRHFDQLAKDIRKNLPSYEKLTRLPQKAYELMPLLVFANMTFWRIQYEEETHLSSLRSAICHQINFQKCHLGTILENLLQPSSFPKKLSPNQLLFFTELSCIIFHANHIEEKQCCGKQRANALLRKQANDWMIEVYNNSELDLNLLTLLKNYPVTRINCLACNNVDKECMSIPNDSLSLIESEFYKDIKYKFEEISKSFKEEIDSGLHTEEQKTSYRQALIFLILMKISHVDKRRAKIFPEDCLSPKPEEILSLVNIVFS